MSDKSSHNEKKCDALHEIADNEKLYKIAIESLSTMFYVQRMEPDYRTIYVSPAFESVGYSYEEWYSNPKLFFEKTHPKDVKRIQARNKELKANAGTESDYEYRFITKSGEIRWWHDRGKLIKCDDGEPDLWVGIIQDITEKKNAQIALLESEKQKRELIEYAHDIIYTHDLDGNIKTINQAVERIAGYTVEEALQMNMREFVVPEYFEIVVNRIKQKVAGVAGKPYEIDVYGKDNKRISLEISSRLILKDNKPYRIEGIARDVTERNRLSKELDKFYNLSYDILATLDFDGIILQINPTWERNLGYERKDVINHSILEFIHPEDRKKAEKYGKKISDGTSASFEIRMRCKNGEYRWFEWGSIPAMEDKVSYAVARDITGRKESEKQLQYNALHDSLTGLPNRKHFLKHLDLAIERATIEPRFQFSVLFIDLDRFKIVNDSLGHIIGDKLLVRVAEILKSCVRPSDVIARMGGDEFTILVTIKADDDAVMVADRIQERISKPINIEGFEVVTSASVGIILSDTQERKAEDFLRDADMAMYHAKESGKARYEIFNKKMHAKNREILQIETDLRRALKEKEFRVYYQPIVDLNTGEVTEFESLIRWEHPRKGLLYPEYFIDIAEETGLIIPIGTWVLEESCRQILKWEKSLDLPLQISVNLSAKQLTNPFLVSKIEKVIKELEMNPDKLKLEVTESTVMENTDVALKTIDDLNQIGVRLSTDDFGTGYSSLSYLHLFPFERIKIDRSFIGKMDSDLRSEGIVRSIMMLGQNLEIDIVAEGIENQNQLWQLRSLGCKLGQGFLFSHAVDADKAEKILKEGLDFNFENTESPFAFSSEFDTTASINLDQTQ